MRVKTAEATIASGSPNATFDIADTHEPLGVAVGVIFPATLTSTSFTVKAGESESDLKDVYDKDGNQLTITAAADRKVWLDPVYLLGDRIVRLVGNANEGAARDLKMLVREVS